MLAAKDSKPVTSGEWETTTTEREKSSTTSMPQPSGLGELATTTTAPAGRGQGVVQRVQVGSASGADKSEMSRDGANRKLSPTLVTRPKKYALEIWVELEVSPGVYGAPEDDSYGIDFVMEILNQAYPGCTGLYLDVAGHMVAFYGKKGHSKAGLLHEQGIQASQAIATIPTWMGYPATRRMRCVSVTEASEIVTACKRLERENWRRAHWELQHRFSTMRLGSTLSAVTKPFQPQTASSSTLVDSPPQGSVNPASPRESSPATAVTLAYASRIMNDTEPRYHSTKQEFLALKWAVTDQFHEYLSPYGKNRNEFVVRTDNNPLTYIFSSTNLDAAGQRWVAQLASYNFSLEYQKGKDNTVADFLSRLDEPLPKREVQDYLDKIPYPGVKAVLDNAITPLEEWAELGVRPNPEGVNANQEEAVAARAAKLASTNIIDWKVEQKEDPVLYQVVKHLRAPRETFKEALLTVLDKKATATYVKAKEQLLLKNGLLYRKTHIRPAKETIFQFVVPPRHRSVAMDSCHREAAHQGQRRSASLMQEQFWWPGMARDLRNRIRKCGRCHKFEAAPPIAPMQPLTCSGPGELLHVDFTSIEETVPLKEEPVIRNVLVLQDHFSKYVVTYVVKDQTARTTAVTLRNGYFGLFGAPAYLVSDQGKAFTGHLITHLCELYGVQKLRTSPYHAQTNGQVKCMNQTIIRMIGKLAEDKKAHWSEHRYCCPPTMAHAPQ